MNIYTTFLDNKYTRWYANLIAKSIARECPSCYTERHHILPKSIFQQYRTCSWNIVRLTAREHVIAHLLLTKMYAKNTKEYRCMIFACTAMFNLQAHKERRLTRISSRVIAIIRELHATEISQRTLGKKHTSITKLKIGAANKGKRTGKKASLKTKEKMKRSQIGRIRSKEHNAHIREALLGRSFSEESKRKMSEARRGIKLSPETRMKMRTCRLGRKRETVECPTCRRVVATSSLSRHRSGSSCSKRNEMHQC